MRKRAKRIYGILLSMSMLLTLVSMPVWATETVETGAGYEQEQKQTQEQEQKQIQEQKQTQEQRQTQEQKQIQQQEEVQAHEYTEVCDTLTKNCVHVHTSECYPQTTGTGTVSGNDAMESEEVQPTACTHVCSEESSGINVENTLRANGLPIVMAPNNRGDVELKQDTIGNYRVQSPGGDSFYRLPSGNYRLGEDITLDKRLVIGKVETSYTVSLDLNGHKLEMGDDNTISLLDSSELNIKNASQQEGEIINGSKRGIRINLGAKLRVYGGTIDSILIMLNSICMEEQLKVILNFLCFHTLFQMQYYMQMEELWKENC